MTPTREGSTHWATAPGAALAERRATRRAARTAEAETEAGRNLPAAVLAQRFAAVAAIVVEAVDAFARAAEILIEADPPSALVVQLKKGSATLGMRREDDVLVVTFGGPSRTEQELLDLTGEDFSAASTARRIAETWFAQLAVTEGGPMSTLSDISTRLQQAASALVHTAPNRDHLVSERDALLAAPPPAPADSLAPPEPPSCTCPHCTTRAANEQAVRVTFASWASRVQVLERQLFALTFGGEDDRDEVGDQLAELSREILSAIQDNRAIRWERGVDYDGRGRALRAWETSSAIGEQLVSLVALYREARGPLTFLRTGELTAALADRRARLGAVRVMPLKRPLDPDVAIRAGVKKKEDPDHGLTPAPSGNLLEGTVRFTKRGGA